MKASRFPGSTSVSGVVSAKIKFPITHGIVNLPKSFLLTTLSATLALTQLVGEPPQVPPELPALTVKGENFVDPSGKPVRFWGVNLVALYPERASADALAANLASLGINLVRPHHNLRHSLDWNPNMLTGALLTYKGTSREFDPSALERFDYLNAAFRRHGIYVQFSANWTRRYLPDDFDILPGDNKEREAWQSAMKELMAWDWRKGMDIYKMLPSVDERAALLNEEFVKNLLTHVNPFTGVAYAQDPQVVTYEIMNEGSTEYSVICGNRLPDYWNTKFAEKWNVFARAAGIEPGDIYRPVDSQTKEVRAKFLRKLDEDYLERIAKVIRSTGCKAAITYSNLWRGENTAQMNSLTSGFIEDHIYTDPMVVKKPEDGFYALSRSALVDKPFFVGELNQAEGEPNIKAQSPARTMLPLATAAYAALQNWTGIVWFAWIHGGQLLGGDGWAVSEGRDSSLGAMIADGMMIDHMRTTGIIFRRGLVEQSREPFTLWIDDPLAAGDYNGLMRGKYPYKPGWQNVHEVRKAFGKVPESQASAPWMTETLPNPIVSDTKQIVKDIARRQLTVTAPQAEAFSGYPDGQPPAGLRHLTMDGGTFVTAVLVADDGKDFEESSSLILSRTALDSSNAETGGPGIRLLGLKKPSQGQHWYLVATRPRATSPEATAHQLDLAPDGSLELPPGGWHECELHLREK